MQAHHIQDGAEAAREDAEHEDGDARNQQQLVALCLGPDVCLRSTAPPLHHQNLYQRTGYEHLRNHFLGALH